MSTIQASPPSAPIRRGFHTFGFLSLLSGLCAMGLTFIGDPYWLAVPVGAMAIALGRISERIEGPKIAAAALGPVLGSCALLMWFVLDVVLGKMLGYEFSIFN